MRRHSITITDHQLQIMDIARQLIAFVGALLILIAYAGHQMSWINARSAADNILNAGGSAILLWIALHPLPNWIHRSRRRLDSDQPMGARAAVSCLSQT